MTNLLWFTAINRAVIPTQPYPQDIESIVQILHDGLTVPSWPCRTKDNESKLGISPNRVYAYLGRTRDEFGPTAIVVSADAIEGDISPFDTGGLVDHIEPVTGWATIVERELYLKSLTWSSKDLEAVLALYPSTDAIPLQQYLDGISRPDFDGPHAPLKKGTPKNIWRNPKAVWSWWTWEMRSERIAGGPQLRHWTCSPGDHQRILQIAETRYGADEEWIIQLENSYSEGGVGPLVEALRSPQAA